MRPLNGSRRRGESAVSSHEEIVKAAREEIGREIVASSVDMTKSVIRMVKRRGNATALRFLWSLADMPLRATAGESNKNALSMKSLIRKLGLREGNGRKTIPSNPGEVESL